MYVFVVTEWHKNLHQKLDQHLQKKETLADEEAVRLGKKNQEQYPFKRKLFYFALVPGSRTHYLCVACFLNFCLQNWKSLCKRTLRNWRRINGYVH
jgi:hypothetical protein